MNGECSKTPPKRFTKSSRDIISGRTHGKVMLVPMVCYIDALGYPDLVVLQHVVDEAPQRRRTTRPADQTAMQADRHHFRATLLALFIERVEGILEIGEELIAGIEALWRGEAH